MKMSMLMTDLILKIFGYAFISSAIIGFLHDMFILIYSIIIIHFKLEMPMPLENYSLFGRINIAIMIINSFILIISLFVIFLIFFITCI